MYLLDKIRMRLKNTSKAVLHENTGAYQQNLSKLTTLEYKIFMLLREGFSRKECSQRLHMKRREVKISIKTILRKLNVRSFAELIVKYREKG